MKHDYKVDMEGMGMGIFYISWIDLRAQLDSFPPSILDQGYCLVGKKAKTFQPRVEQ